MARRPRTNLSVSDLLGKHIELYKASGASVVMKELGGKWQQKKETRAQPQSNQA